MVKIEYQEGKLRVYINDILQAKVSIDIKETFEMKSNMFYLGMTASTGELT